MSGGILSGGLTSGGLMSGGLTFGGLTFGGLTFGGLMSGELLFYMRTGPGFSYMLLRIFAIPMLADRPSFTHLDVMKATAFCEPILT